MNDEAWKRIEETLDSLQSRKSNSMSVLKAIGILWGITIVAALLFGTFLGVSVLTYKWFLSF